VFANLVTAHNATLDAPGAELRTEAWIEIMKGSAASMAGHRSEPGTSQILTPSLVWWLRRLADVADPETTVLA